MLIRTIAWGAAYALAATAQAAVFTVNSTIDAVDANPADGICATAGGVCSLRAAVQQANATAGPDTIALPAGTFYLSLGGPPDDTCMAGDLDVTGETTITGAGRDATVIDCLGADRALHVVAPGQPLRVYDLTIRNGWASVGPSGGAVFTVGPGGLTVARVAFLGNSAASGGAICSGGGDLLVEDTRFEGNRAIGGPGGAIMKFGLGAVAISGCRFAANVATGEGGAVMVSPTGMVTVSACIFSGCEAGGPGGALRLDSPVGVVVRQSQFVSCRSGAGGGAFVSSPVTGEVTDCTFVRCSSLGDAGGLRLTVGGAATLTSSSFTENTAAGPGGGARLMGSPLTVAGCTFRNNSCMQAGGGLECSGGGQLTVRESLFEGNRSTMDAGGGLRSTCGGACELTDCTFAYNTSMQNGGGAMIAGRATNTLNRCRFTGNTALGVSGGGLDDSGGGDCTMLACEFSNNEVSGNGKGGGANVIIGGKLTMEGCLVADNQATGTLADGGGIRYTGPAATSTVANCTFSGNIAGHAGGGFLIGGAGVIFRNCTFADNAAIIAGGGALYRAAGVTQVLNTILTGSLAGGNCAGPWPFTSLGGNISSDGTCALGAASDRINTDPRIGPLRDNGGPMRTHALLAGSPAIDAVPDPATSPSADMRGRARPQDGNGDGTAVADIGAFETFDCNGNGADDWSEVRINPATDCNANNVPDGCESPDGDADGIADQCDTCTDTDGDGYGDAGYAGNTCATDGCPADPAKGAPGQCGCGNPDTDTDGDGAANCADLCPADPAKTAPGRCGCGNPDTDTDGDGVADCVDNCPGNPNADQADSDGDGVGNACDAPPDTDSGQSLPAQPLCAAGTLPTMTLVFLGLCAMRGRRRTIPRSQRGTRGRRRERRPPV